MERRSFLKWLGVAPAAISVPEKMALADTGPCSMCKGSGAIPYSYKEININVLIMDVISCPKCNYDRFQGQCAQRGGPALEGILKAVELNGEYSGNR